MIQKKRSGTQNWSSESDLCGTHNKSWVRSRVFSMFHQFSWAHVWEQSPSGRFCCVLALWGFLGGDCSWTNVQESLHRPSVFGFPHMVRFFGRTTQGKVCVTGSGERCVAGTRGVERETTWWERNASIVLFSEWVLLFLFSATRFCIIWTKMNCFHIFWGFGEFSNKGNSLWHGLCQS